VINPKHEQIQRALSKVIDPELGKNIVELGMVRDIQVKEGSVQITLALTIKGCPMKGYLQEQTRKATESVPGVKAVSVNLTSMTEQERARLKERLSPAMQYNKIGRMVAIMSGKGGVGKSSVTALLASTLRKMGHSVGIIDADITGPSIPKLFGVTGPIKGLPMGIMPAESSGGIKIISTNLMLPEEDMAVIWRGPVMSSTIQQFWRDVLWGRVDYLFVDLPPGTSDATLTAMQSLPLSGVVMVTTPQSLSSMVVRKTVNMAQSLEVPILGIVENMSYFICPETGCKHNIFGPSHISSIATLAKAPIIGSLPLNPELTLLADEGKIELYENPSCTELANGFTAVAAPREPAPVAPWLN
jgi:ATP-binding protein involved in chromosome partitioning